MSEKENNLNMELTAEQRLSLIEEVVNAKGLAGLIDVIEAIKSYFPNTEIPGIERPAPKEEATPNNDIYASLAETKIYDPAFIPKVAEDVLNRQNNPNVIDKSVETKAEDVSLGSVEEIQAKKRVLEPPKNNFPDAKVVSPGSMYNNNQ